MARIVIVMDKGPDAFRTISEVADDLDLPQHVLRFWETRFTPIRPLKRGGGRRYYRPDDIDLLKGIRHLLYGQGYTIKGVQRILKEDGLRFVQAIGRGEEAASAPPHPEPRRAHPEPRREDDEEPEPSALAFAARPGPGRAGDDTPDPRDTAIAVSGASIDARHRDGLAALSDRDLGRLKAALDDLLECERIIGTLKADLS